MSFVWGAGGEQQTTAQRRLAEELMKRGTSSAPIQHWTQGVNRVAEALLGAKMSMDEDAADKAATDQMLNHPALAALGPAPGIASPVAPAVAEAAPAMTAPRQPAPVAALQPERMVFDANELNPIDAASRPSGAVRVAAALTGNVPQAAMAPRAGPAVMPSARVWGDAEAEAAGLYEKPATLNSRFAGAPGVPADAAALPPNAQPAQYMTPGQTPPGPIAAPVAGPRPEPQIAPATAAYINAAIKNPRTRAAGMQLLQAEIARSGQAQYGFQTTQDGTVLRSDPRRGTVEPIYRSEAKPTYGDLGIDPATGQPVKGWIDPSRRAIDPVRMPGAPDPAASVIPPPPPGMDPKIWNEAHSKARTAGALPADSKEASALRKEIQDLPSYKNMAQAAPVYKSMLDAAGRDNRAADVNLIYGLAKVMDPGSVVRESEMTVAQAVATLPQQLKATVESQLNATGRLTPEIRQQLMQEAHSRVASYQSMFDQDAGMYRGIAGRNRMHEDDVIPKFGPFGEFKAPAPPAPQFTPEQAAAELKRRQQKGAQ